MRHAWATELLRFTAVVLASLAAGWLASYPYVFLAAGLGVYLLWHLHRLTQLARNLSGEDKSPLPSVGGLWRPMFEAATRLRSRSRRRKRRLSRFLERFREAATAFPDAAAVLGRGGEVQWCNPAAGSLLGLDWPAAAGKRLTDLVRDSILAEYLQAHDYSKAVVLASPASKGRLLSVHVTPFGRKHQRLLIGRDITSTYNVDRVRRDFVANVSHELRTPLTVISGFLETLGDDAHGDADQQRSMLLMQEQAARMATLIDDLLTLSRLELDDEPQDPAPVSVAELLESIVGDARRLSGDQAHQIELHADPDLVIRGKESELRSAFSNLVFNAVRHTPHRTRIRVEWRGEDGGGRLTVDDDGPGIPARHLPRLSERFYRVDESRSRDTGGTGLGLAIVKHVLERHHGELHIESDVGKGSRFLCVFAPSAVVARAG
jgi:two-component system, OmpR family, phosphate regulon sensor histidine kinase PhoR